jgi:proline iminopeptidase
MNDPDPQVRNQAAADWRRWEDVVLSLEPGAKLPADSESLDSGVLAFVRLTTHYCSHAGWLDDQAVIRDAGRLAGIPGVLIHGRLDLSCPIETAWELARSWPGSQLLIDDHSGHRGSDIKRAWMLETLDRFASRLACTIRPDAPVAVYAFLHNRLVTGSELDGTTESVVANGVFQSFRRLG